MLSYSRQHLLTDDHRYGLKIHSDWARMHDPSESPWKLNSNPDEPSTHVKGLRGVRMTALGNRFRPLELGKLRFEHQTNPRNSERL